MKIDSLVLNELPQEQRERFEEVATEIVCESFIFTADRDYLTARFAFFQKQSHLFLWSAAQAIEKYLKANILLLGSGCIKKTHLHTELAKTLRASEPKRLEIDILIPDGWPEQGVTDWPSLNVDGFLERIETLGSPDVRYDQVQLDVYLQDLVFLDRMAFSLRDRLVVESVQNCQLVGDQLKSCFLNLNFSYAPADYDHPSLANLRVFHTSVTTLEAALKGCYGHPGLFGVWVKKSMGLKDLVVEKLSRRENTAP
jgi:hypothetical protein